MKKYQVTQQELIDYVATYLPADKSNDLPAIREALNNAMDYYEKAGELSRARADKWKRNLVKSIREVMLLCK